MAQVVIQRGWGGTEVLKIEERRIPEPIAGQVVLNQKAVGFNYFDILQRKGVLSANEPGRVMGIEAAGVIKAVGPDTPGFSVGDRVAYLRSQGAYATERVVDASVLIKLPDALAFEDAAAITVKGFTAWLTANVLFAVQPGQTLLVTTAAGGVGSLVTRLATSRGARVIGVVGSSSKRDAALANGAVDVAVGLPQGLALALDASSGVGADAVFDGIGAGVAEAVVEAKAIRRGGTIVSFGSAGGWVTADPAAIAAEGISLINPLVTDYLKTPEELRSSVGEVYTLKLAGAFGELPVTQYPLVNASRLHDDAEQRRLSGLAVLIP